MKSSDLQELLIDYAEGTLDSSKKEIVAEMLKVSADIRREYDIILSVFSELRQVENSEVPSFYFENFLPRLKSTIVQKKSTSILVIPGIFYKLAAPLAIVVVTVSLIGLYQLFNPVRQEILAGININDIDRYKLQEMMFFQDAVNVPQISDKEINHDLIAGEMLPANGLYGNAVSDRQILTQLDDSGIEYILDRLRPVQ